MTGALRTVRLIQIALLSSIAIYVLVGERFAGKFPHANATFYQAVSVISISVVGVIFVVWRTLLAHSQAELAAKPNDNVLVRRWRAGYIVIYALCESLALFGLMLRVLGFPLSQTWTFYLSAFTLMLLFWPRRPKSEFGS